jgi:hypothetical protein
MYFANRSIDSAGSLTFELGRTGQSGGNEGDDATALRP